MKFLNFKGVCSQVPLANGKEATVNRALDGSMYPIQKLVHSVFDKINYGGLKPNSLYLGLVLPSGGWQSLIGFYLRMNVDAFKSNSQLIYWNTEINNYTLI